MRTTYMRVIASLGKASHLGSSDADHRRSQETTRTESQIALQGLQTLRSPEPRRVRSLQKMPQPQHALEETRTRRKVELNLA